MAAQENARLQLPDVILASRIIAVLRAAADTHLLEVARRLHHGGIDAIEVTLTTPGAFAAIERIRAALGDSAAIGAGSVLSVGDLERAKDAGATYTLAPSLDLDVVRRASELAIAHVPGAATPTEAVTAWNAGAAAVKIFPISHLGGPGFLRAVREPLPMVKLIPTGGVAANLIGDYLDAGAIAVGVGGPLLGTVLRDGPDDEFEQRIEQFRARAARQREGEK